MHLVLLEEITASIARGDRAQVLWQLRQIAPEGFRPEIQRAYQRAHELNAQAGALPAREVL
jgi:hypothetical protein